jgi:hypothetical protein
MDINHKQFITRVSIFDKLTYTKMEQAQGARGEDAAQE